MPGDTSASAPVSDAALACADDAATTVSIYDTRDARARWRILLSASLISLLTPVTDTIILPALGALRGDLPGSTADTDAALVSAYMVALGVCSLAWGPMSDALSRRAPLAASIVLFLAATLGCVFARDAAALLGARAAQGAFVGATIAITQGIVADVFAPAERGTALGLFFVPLLVGPIVAPVVGGALTAAAGWRAIFYLLAAAAPPLLALVAAMPETHHFLAARAWAARPGAPRIREPIPPRACASPLAPLAHLADAALAPFIACGAANFAVMFVSLTQLPTLLAEPPYSLSPAVVGAAFLPVGVAMMAGSVIGGGASDRAGARAPGRAAARLAPALAGAAVLIPGAIGFGLAAHGGSLGGILASQALVGLGQALYMPGLFAFLSTLRQADAASVASATMAAQFAVAGAAISAAPPIAAALGVAALFGILAAAAAAALAVAALAARRSDRADDAAALGASGRAADAAAADDAAAKAAVVP